MTANISTQRALRCLSKMSSLGRVVLERLGFAISLARQNGSHLAVLCVALDDFEPVLAEIGEAAAGRLVAEVGTRLAECVRDRDTIHHVGGAQFVLLCAAIGDTDDAAQIGTRILAAIRQPIDLDDTVRHLGATVGISVYPGDGDKPNELIAKAAAAMYLAKQNGCDAFLAYSSETEAGIERTLKLESDLRHAIAGEQFVFHYQPIVDAASWRIVGAEALIRWQHPAYGLIRPEEFVPFAEEHGLVAQIDAIALRAACSQLRRLTLAEGDMFSLAVNVSACHFREPGFAETVAAILASTGVDPKRLEIEVNETVVSEDAKPLFATLGALKELGARLSIDEFGIGHGSLARIENPPARILKVDRSFVARITNSATDQTIMRTIVRLAHHLGLRVTAEGVESSDQVASLAALGCDNLQGHFIGRPLAAEEFERLVRADRTMGPSLS
jgi:diguanylate cyclase